MGTITFSGLSTGINTSSLIDELVRVERQPITLLERRQTTLQKNVTLLQEVSGKFSALKSAATKLSTTANFFLKKISSNDEKSLSATTGSNADVGNHLITVNSLARTSTFASASFNDITTTTVGTGALKISIGGIETEITVTPSNNTLQGLRDAINNAGAGVTAATILETDGPTPTYRLVVAGQNSGTANAVSIDASGLIPDGQGGGGTPTLSFTTTQAAQNASLTVDGIVISRSTNTISDVITGVTLDVKGTSSSPIQVTVNNDTEAIKTQLNDFVKAYNDIQSFIATQTKYDSTTKTAGPLIGDSALRTLQNNLQSVISTVVTGTPSLLAEIGVSTQRDGTLAVDDVKLSNALRTNLNGVSNLFLSASSGVAKATVDFTTRATRSGDGIISGRISGIQDTIRGISKQIERQTDNLEKFRETLVRRFASLETLVSQIQGQGQFLTQRLASSRV